MSATPIIPGHAYRVRHAGRDYLVPAAHPCDALIRVLELTGDNA